MITAELRINAQLIGHIYCVNEASLADGWVRYRYEFYDVTKEGEAALIRGRVTHFKEDGAIALFREICEDISTKAKT